MLFDPSQAYTLPANLRPAYSVHARPSFLSNRASANIASLLQTVVDIILESNPRNPRHPVHKHGTPAYIIGQGSGAFNWSSVAEAIVAIPSSFNLVDPPLRDGFLTAVAGTDKSWTVIRYEAPANTVTFMHCHINEHLFGGMAVVLLEGFDHLPPIPAQYLSFEEHGTF